MKSPFSASTIRASSPQRSVSNPSRRNRPPLVLLQRHHPDGVKQVTDKPAKSGERRTMTLHRTLIAVAFAAVVPAAGARSASLTPDQAFARASKCLKAHGARDVISRGFNLGGLAQYPSPTGGTASFKYEVSPGPVKGVVVGVHLWFGGSTGPTRTQKVWAQRCVSWGVPLIPR